MQIKQLLNSTAPVNQKMLHWFSLFFAFSFFFSFPSLFLFSPFFFLRTPTLFLPLFFFSSCLFFIFYFPLLLSRTYLTSGRTPSVLIAPLHKTNSHGARHMVQAMASVTHAKPCTNYFPLICMHSRSMTLGHLGAKCSQILVPCGMHSRATCHPLIGSSGLKIRKNPTMSEFDVVCLVLLDFAR